MELKTEDYIELAQVVQVFESSIFNNVRIKLLNPNKFPYLIKTLYAILLLLPQGQAFDALTTRLRCLEIIFSLDDEEEEEDFISSFNENGSFEENKKDNFSEKSSCSNFELSAGSINNLQNENIKFSGFQLKKFSKKNFPTNEEDEIFQKKRVKKYIDIFNEVQHRKKEFEKKIKENDQINRQNYCYSPSYYVK